jgi:hypothetical protein
VNDERALNITGVALGVFLSVIFVVYLVFSLAEGKGQKKIGAGQKFAGLVSFAIGVMMAGAWVYLIVNAWDSFQTRLPVIWFHVVTEMISFVSILISGIAMFRNWSRGPALYLISNALFLLTTLFALLNHGTEGHTFLMNGVSVVAVIVSVYMVALVFGWQHFVLMLDQHEGSKK